MLWFLTSVVGGFLDYMTNDSNTVARKNELRIVYTMVFTIFLALLYVFSIVTTHHEDLSKILLYFDSKDKANYDIVAKLSLQLSDQHRAKYKLGGVISVNRAFVTKLFYYTAVTVPVLLTLKVANIT